MSHLLDFFLKRCQRLEIQVESYIFCDNCLHIDDTVPCTGPAAASMSELFQRCLCPLFRQRFVFPKCSDPSFLGPSNFTSDERDVEQMMRCVRGFSQRKTTSTIYDVQYRQTVQEDDPTMHT